ncbi:MAG: hypothetical protein AB7F78_21925, partial [Hyphomicrobiaceae bacterium]
MSTAGRVRNRWAATALAAAAFSVVALDMPGFRLVAQTVPQAPPAERKSPGDPGKEAPKQAPTPSPKTPRGLPQPRADGARALDKLPQTAEDKKRQLSDLYAL